VDDVVAADVTQQPEIVAQRHGTHRFGLRATQVDQVHAGGRDARHFSRRWRGEDQDVVAATCGGKVRPELLEIEPVTGEVRPKARKKMQYPHMAPSLLALPPMRESA
jgi:hypothetical protein